MPFAIDEEAMKKSHQLDIAKPPVINIGHLEFPKVVYDHAKAVPGHVEEVRDINGRATTEHVAANLAHKIVRDEKELKEALKRGYSVQPPTFNPPDEAA